MTAYLARLAKASHTIPECKKPVYKDVAADHLFCTTITWARDTALTYGVGNGTRFAPDDPVNRAAMASFLHRAARLLR